MRVWNPTTRLQPALGDRRPGVGGVERELGERRRRPLEHRHATGEIQRLLRVQPRDARVGIVLRAEAVLGLVLLVVLEDLVDLEHRDGLAGLVEQRDAVAARRRVHGEAHGKSPRQPAREVHLPDDEVVVGAPHEALERGERAGGEHVQVRELPRRQLDGLERVEVTRPLSGPVDEGAAVRRDQAVGRRNRHARTSAGMWPSSSSFAMTCAAASSGSVDSVSTTISGLTGASYGSSTPVKPLISPAKALA